jgi:hypothetical protein
MPLPGNGVPAGSVPLDALDARQVADLLAVAARVAGALVGDPGAKAACAQLAPDWNGLQGPLYRPRGRRPTWTTRSTPIPAPCTPDPGAPRRGPPARTHLEN